MTEAEAVNTVHRMGTIRIESASAPDYERLRSALLVYAAQMSGRGLSKQSAHAVTEVKRLDKALAYNPGWKYKKGVGE